MRAHARSHRSELRCGVVGTLRGDGSGRPLTADAGAPSRKRDRAPVARAADGGGDPVGLTAVTSLRRLPRRFSSSPSAPLGPAGALLHGRNGRMSAVAVPWFGYEGTVPLGSPRGLRPRRDSRRSPQGREDRRGRGGMGRGARPLALHRLRCAGSALPGPAGSRSFFFFFFAGFFCSSVDRMSDCQKLGKCH